MLEINPLITIAPQKIIPTHPSRYTPLQKTAAKMALYSSAVLSTILLFAGGTFLYLGLTSTGIYFLIGSGGFASIFALGAMIKSLSRNLRISTKKTPFIEWKFTDTSKAINDLHKRCSSTLESFEPLSHPIHKLNTQLQVQKEKSQKIKELLEEELEDLEKTEKHLSALHASLTSSNAEVSETELSLLGKQEAQLNKDLTQQNDTERQQQLKAEIQALQKRKQELSEKLSLHPLLSDKTQLPLKEALFNTFSRKWERIPTPTDIDFFKKCRTFIQLRKSKLTASLQGISQSIESTQAQYDELQKILFSLEEHKINLMESLQVLKEIGLQNGQIAYTKIKKINPTIQNILICADKKYADIQAYITNHKGPSLNSLKTALQAIWKDGHQHSIFSLHPELFLFKSEEISEQSSQALIQQNPKFIKPSYQVSITHLSPTKILSVKKNKIIQTILCIGVCAGIALVATGIVLFGLGNGASIGVITAATLLTGLMGMALLLTNFRKSLATHLICNTTLTQLNKRLIALHSQCQERLSIQVDAFTSLSAYHRQISTQIEKSEEIKKSLEKALAEQEEKKNQLSNMYVLYTMIQKEIDDDQQNIEKAKRSSLKLFTAKKSKDSVTALDESQQAKLSFINVLKMKNPHLLALLEIRLPESCDKDLSQIDWTQQVNAVSSHINKLKNCLTDSHVIYSDHHAHLQLLKKLTIDLQQSKIDLFQTLQIIEKTRKKILPIIEESDAHKQEDIYSIIRSIQTQFTLFDNLFATIQEQIKSGTDRKSSLQDFKNRTKDTFDEVNIRTLGLQILLDEEDQASVDLELHLDFLAVKKPSTVEKSFNPQAPEVILAATALAKALKTKGPDFISTVKKFIPIVSEAKWASVASLLTRALFVKNSSSPLWGPYLATLNIIKNHDHLILLYLLLTNADIQKEMRTFLTEWKKLHIPTKKPIEVVLPVNEKKFNLEVTGSFMYAFHHFMTLLLPSLFVHTQYSEEALTIFKEAVDLSDEEYNEITTEGKWWSLVLKRTFPEDPASFSLSSPQQPWEQIFSCKELIDLPKRTLEENSPLLDIELEEAEKAKTAIMKKWRQAYPDISIEDASAAYKAAIENKISSKKSDKEKNALLQKFTATTKKIHSIEKKKEHKSFLNPDLIHDHLIPLRNEPKTFDAIWNDPFVKTSIALIPSFIFSFVPMVEGLLSVVWQHLDAPEEKQLLAESIGVSSIELENAAQNGQLVEVVLPYPKHEIEKKAR